MPDEVWPVAYHPPFRTSNGFGTGLKGFTRADGTGRYFATCWYVAFDLPVVPLYRYYLRRRAVRLETSGLEFTTTTDYQIDGESRLRAVEILRTYVFCWLAMPAIVVAPILVMLSNADRITSGLEGHVPVSPIFVIIGAFILWLIGSIIVGIWLLGVYRARWAPIRPVRWIDPPTTRRDWQANLADRDSLPRWDWNDDD
jgi:hypothetical protein